MIARFVRREKIELMRSKKNLKSQPAKIDLNDDVTPLRLRILFSLRRDPAIKSPQSRNEKIIVYKANDSKMALNTLVDVQRAFPKSDESA